MSKEKRVIEKEDLISPEEYTKNRKQFRKELVELKKGYSTVRRIEPFCRQIQTMIELSGMVNFQLLMLYYYLVGWWCLQSVWNQSMYQGHLVIIHLIQIRNPLTL